MDYELAEGFTIEDALGAEDPGITGVLDKGSKEEENDFIRHLLPFLNERERRVLILSSHFGLDTYETARVIGTTRGTINQAFSAIRAKAVKVSQESQLSLADIAA